MGTQRAPSVLPVKEVPRQGGDGPRLGSVDVDAFVRDGYVAGRGAVEPGTAAACRELIWDALAGGCAGTTRPAGRRWCRSTTWTAGRSPPRACPGR